MPELSLHFAHRRRIALGWVWFGLVIGSWIAAYLFARLVIAVGHALESLLS